MTSRETTHCATQPTMERRRELCELLIANREKYVNYLARKLRDRGLAEEIFQEVTVKVLERSSQLRSTAQTEAWLYRIFSNAATDYYRKAGRAPLLFEYDPENLAIQEDSILNPCPCVSRELAELKSEYREALHEMVMSGGSVQHYAESHDISSNLASVRLHRARASLRGRVMKTCGACAGSGCFDCTC